jgi:hypothetical protein
MDDQLLAWARGPLVRSSVTVGKGAEAENDGGHAGSRSSKLEATLGMDRTPRSACMEAHGHGGGWLRVMRMDRSSAHMHQIKAIDQIKESDHYIIHQAEQGSPYISGRGDVARAGRDEDDLMDGLAWI